MPKLETKALDFFKPDPNELARHDDPEETRRLGEDMLARGQLQPVAALEDGRMIFGHGRLLSAKSAGMKTLEAKVYPAMSDTQFMLTRASENLQRKELTAYRRWRLCADLICANPGWQQKDLAEHLHLDPSMVTRLHSPSRCSCEWQEALKAGKVGISDCYAASKLDASEQAGLLALKLGGASRDTLEQAGRRKRSAGTPVVRASKIKLDLGNVTVTISGDGLTLDDAIEAVMTAQKEMRKGRDQGLDAKTLVAVCRDRAKAG